MTGDESEEGESVALAGRKATNLPNNRMSHDVIVSAHQLFHALYRPEPLV